MAKYKSVTLLLLFAFFSEITGFSQEKPGTAIETYSKNINCLRFSAGGTLLAFGDGTSLRVISMTDLKVVSEIKDCHSGRILSLDFSPDSSFIVSGGSDSLIVIWDLNSGKVKKLNYHKGKITTVKIDPSGEMIYTGSTDKRIVCYNLKLEKIISDVDVHTAEVLSLDITNSGNYLASGGADGKIFIIDCRDGKIVNNLEGQKNWIRCVKFNPNSSTLSTGSDNGDIFFWNTMDPVASKLMMTKKKLRSWVTSIDFFGDNSSYCYSLENGTIIVAMGGVNYRLKLKFPVRMMAIQPGNRTFYKIAIATYGDGLIIIDGNSFIE